MLARRGDATKSTGIPMRTCVGCRKVQPQRMLLRVVAGGGAVIIDPQRRLAGRGAWIHPDPACLARAEARLARALRVAAPLSTTAARQQITDMPGTTARPVNEVTG